MGHQLLEAAGGGSMFGELEAEQSRVSREGLQTSSERGHGLCLTKAPRISRWALNSPSNESPLLVLPGNDWHCRSSPLVTLNWASFSVAHELHDKHPETGGLDSKPNSTLARRRHISLLLLRKVGTILAPIAHRGLGIP